MNTAQSAADAVALSPEQIEEYGRELDAIRDEVMDSRGERDRRYILRLIRVERSLSLFARYTILASILCLPVWGHPLALNAVFWPLIALGSFTLALAKILENMEIGHNVLHAQWDWMKDPEIQSNTYEWDHGCPADQWMHSHNVVHHTWTNVMGKDRDIGYGMLRVTSRQPWHPFYLLQPLNALMMALFFEFFISLHDLGLNRILAGNKTWTQAAPTLRAIRNKLLRQWLKDYLAWPLLAVILTVPFTLAGMGPPLWQVFVLVLAANFAACTLRNLWTFMIIFCGHFPAGVFHFSKKSVDGETRAQWYLRQQLGSCNIGGGKLFHILSGNLSHQIEHHLFPDMPSNRYPEVARRVRALADRYAIPYNTGSLGRQFGTTLWKLLILTFPTSAQRAI